MTTASCGKKTKKGKQRKHTPITSQAQQSAMGVAYAAKKGEISMSELKGPAKEMVKSMPKAELKRHLKESKGKSLPEYASSQQAVEKRRERQKRTKK